MIHALRAPVYTGFLCMKVPVLKALSPVDGRYADKVDGLRDTLSEYGLIRCRVLVEIRWLQCLADEPSISELAPLSSAVQKVLNDLVARFSADDAERVKAIESRTNHDVKAVEYFIRERLGNGPETVVLNNFLHFACTSEDINNLSYALMLKAARNDTLLPRMRALRLAVTKLARRYADIPMLARTHGQAASPTSVGKEFMNVAHRLARTEDSLFGVAILGKCNGAVGNFNAHRIAYPQTDWRQVSRRFVASLGLEPNSHTTQIEPHDWMAEYAHALIRYNTVLIDFCRDVWGYIALGYFRPQLEASEVGSSTMPHKVNPIDVENAEGTLGMATAMLEHFAEKLPISRWQRDLSDSTVQRNIGVAIAYTLIAVQAALKGVEKLKLDPQAVEADLAEAWEVLGEAVQTVMRRYGIADPYEKLKSLTRGQAVTRELLAEFVTTLNIPEAEKQRLLALTPASYLGLAAELARDAPGQGPAP